MNEETTGNDPTAAPQDAGSAGTSDSVPIFRRKESGRQPSILKRTVAVLALEPGISEEIASDRGATKQALAVLAIATFLAGGLPDSPNSLLAPLYGLLPLTIRMLLLRLVSRMFAKEVPAYMYWFRALLFASAPFALGVIPQIGSIMGRIYGLVLEIVVIRDLSHISTGQAVGTWVIAMLVPLAVLTLSLIFVGYSIFGRLSPTLFEPLLGL